MTIPVWLDCDPGHDDTVAILLALFHPAFELIAISTTYGNSSLPHTTTNALSILTAFNRTDIPVYQGYSKPYYRPTHFAPDIHGESGLEGTDLLPAAKVKPVNSDNEPEVFEQALLSAINEHKSKISVVATGPLTNVGHFFEKNPQAVKDVYRFSIMGGGLEVFNYGFSEFNIWCDPHGANKCFENAELAAKTLVAPLEATHKVICTQEIQAKIKADGQSKLRNLLYELMTFFAETYEKSQGFTEGPPLHDPLAVLILLPEYPEYAEGLNLDFKYYTHKIHVVEEETDKVGMFEPTDDANGAKVFYDLNVDEYWKILLQTVDTADKFVRNNF